MGNFTTLPHEQVAAYVRGENMQEIRTQLIEGAGNNTAYLLLFDIIDRFRHRVRIRERSPVAMALPENFATVEEMLLRFFSGEARDDEAQQLFDSLIASPQFYQRLLAKLALIAPPQSLDDVPAMARIHVRGDDELFEQIKTGATIDREPVRQPQRHSAPPVWERLRDWGTAITRMPKYALATVPLLVIAGALTLYTQVFRDADINALYAYDQETPYPYSGGLRVESQLPEEKRFYYPFRNNFKLGMSDYVGHEYSRAIQTFLNIEPAAQMLLQELQPERQAEEKLLRELRDYYFYFGLSHLAVARSRINPLAAAEKTRHLQAATRYLARADSLARLQNPAEENEREAYFLGLTYGFSGKPDSALVQLNKIKRDNRFYEKSLMLINTWFPN